MSHDLDTAEISANADERTTLEAFLEHYREVLTRKISGLSEADARRNLVPSATTLGGLVKHMRWVETSWFERVLAQTPQAELPPRPWSKDEPDGDFRMESGETVDGLIAEYAQQCARSRDIAGTYGLADVVPNPRLGEVSLRWIYIHMIEETARHAGHADILREQVDGTTGD